MRGQYVKRSDLVRGDDEFRRYKIQNNMVKIVTIFRVGYHTLGMVISTLPFAYVRLATEKFFAVDDLTLTGLLNVTQ